jgi:hypothetical protein
MKITNNDLYNKIFSEKILIQNIDNLFVNTIINTQKNLSDDFINNYVLNEKYHKDRRDDMTIFEIFQMQPQYSLK